MARWAGESLRFGVAQGALERRNFFAGEFGQPGEVYKEWQFILTAGVDVLGFMHRSARARWKEEIRFAEGDDSHVPIPKDLLVPVYVKVFKAGGVEDGLKEVGCILGGTVLQPFLGGLVWGHPSSLARTGYCVLVLVLCLPCDHAAFCFCCWLGGQDQMASRGPAAIHDHICD